MIEPSKNYYAFERVPQFWEFLREQAQQGVLGSAELVLQELRGNDPKKIDTLEEWAVRLGSTLFCPVTEDIQRAYSQVADAVNGEARYKPQHVAPFLSKADSWLIAYAMVLGGRIVTHEKPEPKSAKPKIPDVAAPFGVVCVRLWDMLAELNWKA